MGLTAFPNGLSSFGVPVLGGGGLIPATSGSYFWVDSGTGTNGQGSFNDPFSTLANAYNACAASASDVIILKPTHAETLSAAAGIVLNKIGVSIIGLGQGALRPTFTLSGTAATCTINFTAANQVLKNVVITAAVDELVSAITVGAANISIVGVEYRETSVSYQALSFITGNTSADFLTISGCRAMQLTAANGNAPCIHLVGGDDNVIEGNIVWWIGANNAATCGLSSTGTATLRSFVANNIFHVLGGTSVIPISMVASSTGYAINNKVASGRTNVAGSIALAGMYGAENMANNTVNTQAYLDPVSDPGDTV
jgi:hypothetical protein